MWILVRFCWITLFGQTNCSQTIRYMINHPFFTWPRWQPLPFAPHSTSPHLSPQDMHPCVMPVYGHHLVCRWWLAQWVFVGGWLIVRDVRHVSTTMPTQTISVAFCPTLHLPQMSTPQDTHPCAMHVYCHHLICRWWLAQWVFVGGWVIVRDVCHSSTTMPIQIISAEGSTAFCSTLHLPQCQPHRTRIRLQCVSTVIIWYAGGVRPNGCLWGVGVFKCGGYLLLQHHANIDDDGCPSVVGRHVA